MATAVNRTAGVEGNDVCNFLFPISMVTRKVTGNDEITIRANSWQPGGPFPKGNISKSNAELGVPVITIGYRGVRDQ